ncbi:hypothetical protein STEG23_010057, partial [Scotinomys teguina]
KVSDSHLPELQIQVSKTEIYKSENIQGQFSHTFRANMTVAQARQGDVGLKRLHGPSKVTLNTTGQRQDERCELYFSKSMEIDSSLFICKCEYNQNDMIVATEWEKYEFVEKRSPQILSCWKQEDGKVTAEVIYYFRMCMMPSGGEREEGIISRKLGSTDGINGDAAAKLGWRYFFIDNWTSHSRLLVTSLTLDSLDFTHPFPLDGEQDEDRGYDCHSHSGYLWRLTKHLTFRSCAMNISCGQVNDRCVIEPKGMDISHHEAMKLG